MTSSTTRAAVRPALPCPAAARCGGCQLSALTYPEQLKKKQASIERLLGRFCPVRPIIGMEDPLHYRAKVHVVLATDPRTKLPVSGVYAAGTHRVVPVRHCLLHDPRADRIISTIVDMLPRYKLRIYNENTHRGLLRHLMLRIGAQTGQIMVILVATAAELPGGRAFVSELLERHPEITTIVLNVNQKETSMVLGKKDVILHGPGYIEDTLCGRRFRISPQSFYQVNARQTERLYRTAIDLAALTGSEMLLDAYCGTGTIGLCAAEGARELIGVELNAEAVRDARENARLNGVKNARFHADDAGRFMTRMAREGVRPDVLIMDPPRSGSTPQFLAAAIQARPRRIVYVSCGPDTLARDAAVLIRGGYRAVEAVPVDMFPFTEHCECVMCFVRGDE